MIQWHYLFRVHHIPGGINSLIINELLCSHHLKWVSAVLQSHYNECEHSWNKYLCEGYRLYSEIFKAPVSSYFLKTSCSGKMTWPPFEEDCYMHLLSILSKLCIFHCGTLGTMGMWKSQDYPGCFCLVSFLYSRGSILLPSSPDSSPCISSLIDCSLLE